MNGPEHYREAERRLAQAHEVEGEFADYLMAKAQVHATLALAAATAATQATAYDGDEYSARSRGWAGVA